MVTMVMEGEKEERKREGGAHSLLAIICSESFIFNKCFTQPDDT
jgi:hypothetical protein